MAIGTTNISISAINTENSATTSNSLKTLSETAIEGLSTLNEAPYAMSEFQNYTHAFSTTFTGSLTNSGGKADINRFRTTLADNQAVMSDGTFTLTVESARGTTFGLRIIWSSSANAVSTGWTSVTITHSAGSPSAGTNYTINRSSMNAGLHFGVYAHYIDSNSVSYLAGNSSAGTITFNP